MSVSKYQMFLKTVECGSFSRACLLYTSPSPRD